MHTSLSDNELNRTARGFDKDHGHTAPAAAGMEKRTFPRQGCPVILDLGVYLGLSEAEKKGCNWSHWLYWVLRSCYLVCVCRSRIQ